MSHTTYDKLPTPFRDGKAEEYCHFEVTVENVYVSKSQLRVEFKDVNGDTGIWLTHAVHSAKAFAKGKRYTIKALNKGKNIGEHIGKHYILQRVERRILL